MGSTNQGLAAQGDGWNHVRLVKIQGENISPSAHSQVASELVLALRNPHCTGGCDFRGSWLGERLPTAQEDSGGGGEAGGNAFGEGLGGGTPALG